MTCESNMGHVALNLKPHFFVLRQFLGILDKNPNLFMAAIAFRSFSCKNWSKACSASRNSLSFLCSACSSARTSLSRRLASSFFTVNEY